MGLEVLLQLLARYKRRLLLISGLFVVIIFFTQYTFLTVSAPGAKDVSFGIYKGSRRVHKLRGGFNIVPNGTHNIRAITSDGASEKSVSLRPLWLTSTSFKLEPRKYPRKIVARASGCVSPVGELKTASKFLSYTCTNSSQVFAYSFLGSPVSELASSDRLTNITPFAGGLLGFVNEEERPIKKLVFVSDQGSKELPFELKSSTAEENYSIVVLNSGEDQFFVVTDSNSREMTLFKGIKDPAPKKISLEEDSEYGVYQFASAGNTLFALATKTNAENEQEDDLESHGGGKLTTFTLSGDALKQSSVIAVPGSTDLYGFMAVNESLLAVQDLENVIDLYSLKDGALKRYDTITNVDDGVSGSGLLVFRKSSELYVYDPSQKESRLLHNASGFTVGNTQISDGQVIFSASPEGTSNHYSFLLGETEPDSFIDFILAYPADYPYILYVDYGPTAIYVEFGLGSFFSDRETGEIGFDPAELEFYRSKFKEQLANDGIDTSRYQIIAE